MSTITYRDSQGRVIGGRRKRACQHLEDCADAFGHGGDFQISMDEYGVDFEPEEGSGLDGWYIRWEQVRDFEAESTWDFYGWDDFIHEYRKGSRAPRLVLMDSGEVYEFHEGNGDFVHAFNFEDDFIKIAEATEEERGLLPENLPLGARYWPVRWGDSECDYEQLWEVAYEGFRPGVYYSESC